MVMQEREEFFGLVREEAQNRRNPLLLVTSLHPSWYIWRSPAPARLVKFCFQLAALVLLFDLTER
jgi:hypothetical protein